MSYDLIDATLYYPTFGTPSEYSDDKPTYEGAPQGDLSRSSNSETTGTDPELDQGPAETTLSGSSVSPPEGYVDEWGPLGELNGIFRHESGEGKPIALINGEWVELEEEQINLSRQPIVVNFENQEYLWDQPSGNWHPAGSVVETTSSTSATASFVSESAGYKNALYTYDVDDQGQITNVRQLIDDSHDVSAGASLGEISMSDGKPNLLLLPNGSNLVDENSELTIVDGALYINGEQYSGDAYFSHSAEMSTDGKEHFQFSVDEDGNTLVKMEDLRNLGDNDFNDLEIKVTETSTAGSRGITSPDPLPGFRDEWGIHGEKNGVFRPVGAPGGTPYARIDGEWVELQEDQIDKSSSTIVININDQSYLWDQKTNNWSATTETEVS